jgi:hypothetical protein
MMPTAEGGEATEKGKIEHVSNELQKNDKFITKKVL